MKELNSLIIIILYGKRGLFNKDSENGTKARYIFEDFSQRNKNWRFNRMERFGFKPRLDEKYIIVRSSFNLEQAKWLLKIRAFENNPNELKIESYISYRDTPQ